MNTEKIPPLPKITVHKFSEKYINQETMDKAIQVIYDQRPDLFKRSYERDKSWEANPTQDEEAWVHDEFTKDLNNFIRHTVAKEVGIPNDIMLTSIQTCIFDHAQNIARKMYEMPLQSIIR